MQERSREEMHHRSAAARTVGTRLMLTVRQPRPRQNRIAAAKPPSLDTSATAAEPPRSAATFAISAMIA